MTSVHMIERSLQGIRSNRTLQLTIGRRIRTTEEPARGITHLESRGRTSGISGTCVNLASSFIVVHEGRLKSRDRLQSNAPRDRACGSRGDALDGRREYDPVVEQCDDLVKASRLVTRERNVRVKYAIGREHMHSNSRIRACIEIDDLVVNQLDTPRIAKERKTRRIREPTPGSTALVATFAILLLELSAIGLRHRNERKGEERRRINWFTRLGGDSPILTEGANLHSRNG